MVKCKANKENVKTQCYKCYAKCKSNQVRNAETGRCRNIVAPKQKRQRKTRKQKQKSKSKSKSKSLSLSLSNNSPEEKHENVKKINFQRKSYMVQNGDLINQIEVMDEHGSTLEKYENCLKYTKVYDVKDTKFKNPMTLHLKDPVYNDMDVIIYVLSKDEIYFGLDMDNILREENGYVIGYAANNFTTFIIYDTIRR